MSLFNNNEFIDLSIDIELQKDTSELYEELHCEYKKNGAPVEVDFRKIANWVKLGDQLTHQVHPYPAKLLPNIANFFVNANHLCQRGSTVLDPFCGSGTVALEASLAGRIPYVADANPLALLITKVKTTAYNTEELKDNLDRIISRSLELRFHEKIPVVNERIWYSDKTKSELEKIAECIREISQEDIKDFFRVCLSVTARKLSLADPAISVPVRLKTKDNFSASINKRIRERLEWIENASPINEFTKNCINNIYRIEATNALYKDRQPAHQISTDARKLKDRLPLKDENGVQLTVTSPPYGSAQKYIRSSSISLNWLEFTSPKELTKLEDQSIGREHAPLRGRINEAIPLPSHYEDLLLKIRERNETRYHVTRHYLTEIRDAFEEIAKATKPGGNIVIVIGNNSVCGETLRNDIFATEVLTGSGLTLETSLIDHIKSRGLMTKRNKTASVISRESVLIFSK